MCGWSSASFQLFTTQRDVEIERWRLESVSGGAKAGKKKQSFDGRSGAHHVRS
jgi:hypothetical protein